MVKVVIFNGQYRLTIPKEIAESRGWNKDTVLRFIEDLEGNIIIKEVEKKRKKKTDKKTK